MQYSLDNSMWIEVSYCQVGRSYWYGTRYFLCGGPNERACARSHPDCPARRAQLTCYRTGTASWNYRSDRELASRQTDREWTAPGDSAGSSSVFPDCERPGR